MDTATLRVFVDVMRRGGFAAVARDRNLDPSSISRSIAGLEKQLGVRLFQRTTRRISPTDAARAYFERIEPMIDELERASLLAADSGETPRGTLRITAAVAFAQVNLVPLLPEFARRNPALSFELLFTDKFLDLVEERIDLAVRIGRLSPSSLIAHRLCGIVYAACASPEYLRRHGRPKTPTDLERHECLRYQANGLSGGWRFRKRPEDPPTEVRVRGRVIATNGVTLRQCAVAGMGILLLPRWNVAAELRTGALVELFPDYEATVSDFDAAAWILYPSRSYLPRKVRAFADYLKESFSRGAPAEVGLAPPQGRAVRPKAAGRVRRS